MNSPTPCPNGHNLVDRLISWMTRREAEGYGRLVRAYQKDPVVRYQANPVRFKLAWWSRYSLKFLEYRVVQAIDAGTGRWEPLLDEQSAWISAYEGEYGRRFYANILSTRPVFSFYLLPKKRLHEIEEILGRRFPSPWHAFALCLRFEGVPLWLQDCYAVFAWLCARIDVRTRSEEPLPNSPLESLLGRLYQPIRRVSGWLNALDISPELQRRSDFVLAAATPLHQKVNGHWLGLRNLVANRAQDEELEVGVRMSGHERGLRDE